MRCSFPCSQLLFAVFNVRRPTFPEFRDQNLGNPFFSHELIHVPVSLVAHVLLDSPIVEMPFFASDLLHSIGEFNQLARHQLGNLSRSAFLFVK